MGPRIGVSRAGAEYLRVTEFHPLAHARHGPPLNGPFLCTQSRPIETLGRRHTQSNPRALTLSPLQRLGSYGTGRVEALAPLDRGPVDLVELGRTCASPGYCVRPVSEVCSEGPCWNWSPLLMTPPDFVDPRRLSWQAPPPRIPPRKRNAAEAAVATHLLRPHLRRHPRRPPPPRFPRR